MRRLTFFILILLSLNSIAQSGYKVLYDRLGLHLYYKYDYYNTIKIKDDQYDQYKITGYAAYDGEQPIFTPSRFGFSYNSLMAGITKRYFNGSDVNTSEQPNYIPYTNLMKKMPHSEKGIDFYFNSKGQQRHSFWVVGSLSDRIKFDTSLYPMSINWILLNGYKSECFIYILVDKGQEVPTPDWDVSDITNDFLYVIPYMKKYSWKGGPETIGNCGNAIPVGNPGDMPEEDKKVTPPPQQPPASGNNLVDKVKSPTESPARSIEELKRLILENLRQNTSNYNGSIDNSGGKSTIYFRNHLFSFDENNFYFEFEFEKNFSSKNGIYKQYVTPQHLKTKIPIIGLKGVGKYRSNSNEAYELSFNNDGGESTQNEWKEYHNNVLRATNPAGSTNECLCNYIGYKFDEDFKNYNDLYQLIIELNKAYKERNPNSNASSKRSAEELKTFILNSFRNNTKDVTIKYSRESSDDPGVVSFKNHQFSLEGNILSFSVDYTPGDNSQSYWNTKKVKIVTKINLAERLYLNENYKTYANDYLYGWETSSGLVAEKNAIVINHLLNYDESKNSTTLNGRPFNQLYTNIYGFDKGEGKKNFVELYKAFDELNKINRIKK